MLQDLNLAAGVPQKFTEVNNFFRLLEAEYAAVSIKFYAQGVEVGDVSGIGAGYAESFAKNFDTLYITSDVDQSVKFVTRLGNDVRYDTPPVGRVTLENVNGAFNQAQKTVTNASAQLLAANAARRYLLVQNNDASGDVFVTVDGSAATTAKGVKIGAGGSYEIQGFAPVGAINAIGSLANNPNVVIVEG